MTKRKKGKKSKVKKTKFPYLSLLAFILLAILIYYLINDRLVKVEDIDIKPIEKVSKKDSEPIKKPKPSKKVVIDEAYYPATKDSVFTKPEKEEDFVVPVPKPTVTEKGKFYYIDPSLPKICIIVDDFGYVKGKLLTDFLELDKEIAFSIIPDTPYSQETMLKAVKNGHEVLIHAPMEPLSFPKDNPGDNAIYIEMNDIEIEHQITEYFNELYLAIGINHHMGSKAAADKRVMEAVFRKAEEYSLLYIDSYTDSHSVVEKVAKNFDVPFAKRKQFLDVPESSKKRAILKIDEIKKMKDNVIVVITHCHSDVKYRQLKYFIERIKDNNYQIIPPSMAVKIY